MDLLPSPDQEALAGELRRFLADRCTSEARRAIADQPGAVDRELWSELSGMGVFSLCLPESDGGVGLGLADATIVFEELGRALVPGPLVATFVAAGLVDGAAGGQTVVGAVEAAVPAIVEHLDGLDALLVFTDDGVARVAPPAGEPLERPLDPLTPVHLVDALQVGDETVGGAAEAERMRRDAALLTAAFQVGAGQAATDLAVEYAKERQQFGRSIGSFQAVKHLLADAAVALDVARAGVHHAAVSLDEDLAGHDAVRRARIVASEAAHLAGTTGIQVHGGMGFTWELDAHLFLKRTMVLDTTWGGVDATIDAVAAAL